MWNFIKTKKKILIGIGALAVVVSMLSVFLPGVQISPLTHSANPLTQKYIVTIGSEVLASGITADYLCDGTDDNVQWQGALDSLPTTGGEIDDLTGGNYHFSATVTRNLANVTIRGLGQSSYFSGASPNFTAGNNGWTFENLRVDAGSINMGATTGWLWLNVAVGTTLYTERSPNGNIVDNTLTGFSVGGADYPTIFIAASDATAHEKAIAISSGGAVCTGTNDNTTIAPFFTNNARIELSSGHFYWNGYTVVNNLINFTMFSTAGAHIIRNTANYMWHINDGDGFTLTGIEISAADLSTVALFRFTGVPDIVITDCKFHDFYSLMITPPDSTTKVGCTNFHFEYNEIYNYHYSCIDISDGGAYSYVNNNYFHDGTRGLAAQYGSDAPNLYAIATSWVGDWTNSTALASWIFIENNVIKGHNYWQALDLHSGAHLRVLNNSVSDCTAGHAIYYHGGFNPTSDTIQTLYDIVITGNQVDNCADGIFCDMPMNSDDSGGVLLDGLEIGNNTVRNFKSQGIIVHAYDLVDSKGTNINIHDNTVTTHITSYPYGGGIDVESDGATTGRIDGVIINNNTIDGSASTVVVGSVGIETGMNLTGVKDCNVSNNIVKNVTGTLIYSIGSDYLTATSNKLINGTNGFLIASGLSPSLTSNELTTCTTGIDINNVNVTDSFISLNKFNTCATTISWVNAVRPTMHNNLIIGSGYFTETYLKSFGQLTPLTSSGTEFGANYEWTDGVAQTLPAGEVLSLSIYVKKSSVNANLQLALYDSSFNRIAYTSSVLVTSTSGTWFHIALVSPITITAGNYYIFANSDQNVAYLYDSYTSHNAYYVDHAFGTWDNPITPSTSAGWVGHETMYVTMLVTQ